MSRILFAMHCASNTGYAIQTLEQRFHAAGCQVVGSGNVYFSYPRLVGMPTAIPISECNVVEFDMATTQASEIGGFCERIRKCGIDTIVGFDQPVERPVYSELRKSGVSRLVSYWGAPISSVNQGFKLLLKRMEYWTNIHGPDLYVFESRAMAHTATHGRGIPASKVRVIPLGVDCDLFRPVDADQDYAHATFGIPVDRKIIYYSGHMEERKGISVLLETARVLLEHLGRDDFHVLILGNKGNEADRYKQAIQGTPLAHHVTFGGYRGDVQRLQRSAYCAALLSTGWDSLTQSAIELTASGVPLVVSDVGGLPEAVIQGETGYVVPRGDATAAAARVADLLASCELRAQMSRSARSLGTSRFSMQMQVDSLAEACSRSRN